VVGLRPEAIDVATADTPGAMPLRVTLLEQLGADSYMYGTLPGDDADRDKPFVVRVDGRFEPQRGETVHVTARGAVEHVFDPESGARLD
jgi:multiple sugar transport system ATP-binding protein